MCTLPNCRFSINLWSDDKTKIALHYDMRYIEGSIVINTLRHSSPCSFPYGELGFWNSEIRPSDPIPVERNSPFHIQISANGSSDFLIKFIGAGYERTFRNRLEVPLQDITWLSINQQNGSVFIEHICIWSDSSLNNEHNLQYSYIYIYVALFLSGCISAIWLLCIMVFNLYFFIRNTPSRSITIPCVNLRFRCPAKEK